MTHNGNGIIQIITSDHHALAGLLLQHAEQGSVASAQAVCQQLLIHLRVEEEVLNPAARSAGRETRCCWMKPTQNTRR